MRMWSTKDEWTQYASCNDSVDHTIPPKRPKSDNPLDDESHLPAADIQKVRHICDGCRVRPECIMWATDPNKPEANVWVAGRWIPGTKTKGAKVRTQLRAQLPREIADRGDDV